MLELEREEREKRERGEMDELKLAHLIKVTPKDGEQRVLVLY